MKFEKLIKGLEEIDPLTFIAIGKYMGFYLNHKTYNTEEMGRVLGINYERPLGGPGPLYLGFSQEDWGKYFSFRKPVYNKSFGVPVLGIENARHTLGSVTEMSTLLLGEDVDIGLSKTYEGICNQLKKEGFDVRDFVKKIKEEVEPNLMGKFNLDHKLENISPVSIIN